MLASMYSAVSGLQAHQTKMNVIGNNIANVNTYGFKSSRATFSDIFYQTMSGANSPTTDNGGTNPVQLGYGAKVASIDVINTRAGKATTDRALDVYIDGDGYLPVKDSQGLLKYTRVGILSFDVAGNLVDSNGNKVLGFKLNETTGNAQLGGDGTSTTQNLVAIKVDLNDLEKYTSISIANNGEISAIKQGAPTYTPGQTSWINGANAFPETSTLNGSLTMTKTAVSDAIAFVQGSIGKATAMSTPADNADIRGEATLAVSVDAGGNNVYELQYTGRDGTKRTTTADLSESGKVKANVLQYDDGAATTSTTELVFDLEDAQRPIPSGASNSGSVILGNVVPASIDFEATTYNKAGETVTAKGTWNASTNEATTGISKLNLTGDAPNTAEVIALNINTANLGSMTDDEIADLTSEDNREVGSIGPGDGSVIKIAQLGVANFINSGGLTQAGENYFSESSNSGEAVVCVPGTNGVGATVGGSLEMSNVDISKEFTEMIICQRGFQANTRMITVSDEMLSELVSMKR